MTKFKVGDRVRHKYAADRFEGKVATVIDTNWYGQVLCRLDTGQKGSGVEDNWEFAQPESQPIPDRAMALIRRLASEGDAEARAVLAEIEPVDADIITARNLATLVTEVARQEAGLYNMWSRDYSNGDADEGQVIGAIVKALRSARKEGTPA